MKWIILTIYRIVYFFVKLLLFILKPFLNAKMKSWLRLRSLALPKIEAHGQPVFLFHAASGEIEYVKSIIRQLKEAEAQVFIVVSYTSPSAERLFENIRQHVDLFLPLPWDQPRAVRKFLSVLKPHSLFIARTDLWPELLKEAAFRKIKIYVISYNPSLSFVNKLFIRFFLEKATALFCVHPLQVTEIKKLVSKNVQLSAPGDTRFDQVFWRLQQPSRFKLSADVQFGVLGSTWKDDENYILPLFPQIIKMGYKLVWCPHEVDRNNIERIEKLLSAQDFKFVKLSTVSKLQDFQFLDYDILVVDQVGFLADLYRAASWAFVGGSFRHKVHSVMEPLCCAIPILVGPYIDNSPEALKYSHVNMNGLQVVQVVKSSVDFSQAVEKIKNAQSQDFKRLLIGHLEQHRNATRKILHFIVSKTQESLNS